MLAVYDLAVSPPTFDFVGFLISAERERIQLGHDRLNVLIAPGPKDGFRQDRLPPALPERQKMLQNVVMAMCKLLPSCESVGMLDPDKFVGRVDFPRGWSLNNRVAHYGTDKIVQAVKAGCIPLTAGNVARVDKRITMTLRAADYWPTRNSDAAAWHFAALQLEQRGFDVTIIPDANTVRLPGFPYIEAENLTKRATLYASAALNLFVNNGPAWVALFMRDVNCIMFKMCAPSAPCVEPSFFAGVGLPVGSQLPREGFRIVWNDDKAETIINESMEALCQAA